MTRRALPNEQHDLEACLAALHALPVLRVREVQREPAGGGIDGTLEFAWDRQATRYAYEFKTRVTTANLGAVRAQLRRLAEFGRPLLLAGHIAPAAEEALRAEKVPFFETAGNCLLQERDLLVWIEGRAKTARPPAPQRLFRPAGLRVIYLLLCNPRVIDRPYRDLARFARVALGGLALTLEGLRHAGFLEEGLGEARFLRRLPELLDRWTTGYLEALRPRLLVRTCRQAPGDELDGLADRVRETQALGDLRVGGELGAELLTGDLRAMHATLHWTPNAPDAGRQPVQELLERLRLVPDPRGPITVLREFAEVPPAEKADPGGAPGVPLADPILLRAELLAGEPDDRLLKTADRLRQDFIQTRWHA